MFGTALDSVLPATSRDLMVRRTRPALVASSRTPVLGDLGSMAAWGNVRDIRRMRVRPAVTADGYEVTIPPLSDEQRSQARHAATEARRRRAR